MWRSKLLRWIIPAIIAILSWLWRLIKPDIQEIILRFVRERMLKRAKPLIFITLLATVIAIGLGIVQGAREVAISMDQALRGVDVYGEMAWALCAGIALVITAYCLYRTGSKSKEKAWYIPSVLVAAGAIAVFVTVAQAVGMDQKFWYNTLSPLILISAYLAGVWQVLKRVKPSLPPVSTQEQTAPATPTPAPAPSGNGKPPVAAEVAVGDDEEGGFE
jgi:hypothetical protein